VHEIDDFCELCLYVCFFLLESAIIIASVRIADIGFWKSSDYWGAIAIGDHAVKNSTRKPIVEESRTRRMRRPCQFLKSVDLSAAHDAFMFWLPTAAETGGMVTRVAVQTFCPLQISQGETWRFFLLARRTLTCGLEKAECILLQM
jgi:hypothetical protein